MFVDDFADACVFAVQNWTDKGILNVGTGEDITIKEFAHRRRRRGWLQGAD
jgi:GDP-L-fucose synthase